MEKRRVIWNNVTLGEGRPAVCVPVMGKSLAELAASARQAAQAQADVLELRADSLCAMPEPQVAAAMCEAVREAAPGIALLFTLRTARDGGEGAAQCDAYEALLCALVEWREPLFDALDCELSVGEAAFSRIVAKAHAAGISVVGSSHDFSRTPEEAQIVATLRTMERLGADVCKIAVMPQSRRDVLTLMRAGLEAEETLCAPVIAISMGALGTLTRIGAQTLGSCLTFGAAGTCSAPGQMDARTLRGILELLQS